MGSVSNVLAGRTDLPTSSGGRDNNVIMRGLTDRTARHETEWLVAYEKLPTQVLQRRPVDGMALLQTHPVFSALASAQIKHLGRFARPLRIVSGTTLFVKGDPGTAVFIVLSGTVKITIPSLDGREATLNLIHAGEIFGEIALLDGQPRTASAIAAIDCELMVIERRDFLSLVHGEPKVAMKLIELLCARLRVASVRMEELVFLNLQARLAHLLVRLLAKQDGAAHKKSLTITQQKISEMLGTSRESVNKQLQTWAKRKVISLKRGAIVVLEPQVLKTLVGGERDGNGDDFERPTYSLRTRRSERSPKRITLDKHSSFTDLTQRTA
jgi:CRP/FNR family transcriptional regulator, cyclic AMP receptor protein